METMIQLLALCLLGTLFGGVLRRGTPEISLGFTLALVFLGVQLLTREGRQLIATFATLGERVGLSMTILAPLLKTTLIAMIVRIGAAFCRDASQTALAAILEISGTICALLAAEPLLRTILLLLEEWL